MLPTVALVGRPNVGKSTLFNRFTRTRDALVADVPGLTRDRQYGRGRLGDRPFLVVDTGGFEPVAKTGIMKEMARQTREAIAEADVVLFIVDAREGLSQQDRDIAQLLRKAGRPVVLAVNKAEGLPTERATADFHELGAGRAAADLGGARRRRARHAGDRARAGSRHPNRTKTTRSTPDAEKRAESRDRRPSERRQVDARECAVGAERVITFDEPGTTRDAIYLDFERDGRRYTLIDTAGVRRRGKVFEAIEKFSVIKTLQAIEDANVVVLVLDAQDEITEQDAHLAAHILEAGSRARRRRQQVGRPRHRAARQGQARHRAQARVPRVRRFAFHLGAARAAASVP